MTDEGAGEKSGDNSRCEAVATASGNYMYHRQSLRHRKTIIKNELE